MLRAINKSWPFLAGWAVFALLATVVLFSTPKFEAHVWLNSAHGPWGDAAFPIITTVAEGALAALIGIALLFVSFRAFFFVAITHGLTAVFIQFLKRVVFPDHYRPGHFFDQMPDLMLVQGIEQHMKFSFPSGHSAAIFSLCIALALLLNRKHWGVLLVAVAILVGFSRIYLSQHFLQDVLAGSTIGILIPLLGYGLFFPADEVDPNHWLNRNLRTFRQGSGRTNGADSAS